MLKTTRVRASIWSRTPFQNAVFKLSHAAQDTLGLLVRASAFSGRGMVEGIPLAGGDGEIERECHDQDQPGQPVRVSDLAVLEAEATGFEVREHRLDAPTPGVVE